MAFTPSENELKVRINSEGVDQFRGQMQRSTDALFSFKQAVGATGAALAAFSTGAMVASIDAAREFEDSMVELEKVASPETVEEMDRNIREMSETMPVAQEELAGITTQAARFGIEGSDNIQQFTETVSRMAVATDLSTDEAGESLAKLSTLTETSTDDAEKLGAAINVMGNEFATSQSEVVEASLRSSAALNALGARETEIIALNTAMNEVSESSRRAGTRLRRVAQELQDPRKTEDFAAALGMSVEEFERMRDNDPAGLIREMAVTMDEGGESADALRETMTAQSQQAIVGLSSNIDGLDEAMKRSNEEFKTANSLQEEFEKQTDTLSSRVQIFKNRLRNIAIEIGRAFMPATRRALERMGELLTPIERVISETNGMAGAYATAAGAVIGLATAVGTLVSGPLGLATGAVAALGAAYATNFMGIQDIVKETVRVARAAFERFAPSVEQVRAAVERAGERWRWFRGEVEANIAVVESNLGRFRSAFATIFEAVGKNLDVFMSVFDTVRGEVQGNSDAIISAVESFLERFRAGLDVALGLLGRLAVEFADAFAYISDRVLRPTMRQVNRIVERHLGDLISEFLRTASVVVARMERFKTKVMPVVNTLVDGLKKAWDVFGDEIIMITEFAFDTVGSVITTALDGVLTAIRATLALIRGDWGEAFDLMTGFAERTMDGLTAFIGEWGTRFLNKIKENVKSVRTWLKDFFTNAKNWIRDGFDGMVSFVETWIDDMTGALRGFAEDVGNEIRKEINDALNLPFEHTIGEVNVRGETVYGGETIKIPALAEGGVVEKPTLAMVGEAGPEAVVPLDKSDKMGGAAQGNVGQQVASALSNMSVRVETGDETLDRVIRSEAEVVVEERERQKKRRKNARGTK